MNCALKKFELNWNVVASQMLLGQERGAVLEHCIQFSLYIHEVISVAAFVRKHVSIWRTAANLQHNKQQFYIKAIKMMQLAKAGIKYLFICEFIKCE